MLELQVSYDGLKPDGKYGMVFEGELFVVTNLVSYTEKSSWN